MPISAHMRIIPSGCVVYRYSSRAVSVSCGIAEHVATTSSAQPVNRCALYPAAQESWDGISSLGASSDRGSDGVASTIGTSSRRGMLVVLRLENLGLIGEKGTKVRSPAHVIP